MPRSTVTVAHTLGADEAQRRLDDLGRRLAARFADRVERLDHAWYGHVLDVRLRVHGIDVTATVHAAARDVTCHVDVPLIALPFRSRAERVIREELTTLLA